MADVCVNVAFYDMWRTFALTGRPPGWLTGGLLVLGALSALLVGDRRLVAAGLLAATLQVVTGPHSGSSHRS